mgnify:CR=1 FL=1
MQVGDLVIFIPARKDNDAYVVTSNEAYDTYSGEPLPHCVMIAIPEEGSIIPMAKEYLEVISASR